LVPADFFNGPDELRTHDHQQKNSQNSDSLTNIHFSFKKRARSSAFQLPTADYGGTHREIKVKSAEQ
jgi:hypothetical protein